MWSQVLVFANENYSVVRVGTVLWSSLTFEVLLRVVQAAVNVAALFIGEPICF